MYDIAMLSKRLSIAIWLVIYVVAASPVWWQLTSIKRPYLPFDGMITADLSHPTPDVRYCKPSGTWRRGVLTFTLFNADASRECFTWDFPALHAAYVEPIVAAVQPLTAFRVQSQVVQAGLAQQRIVPEWSTRHMAYVVPVKEMPLLLDMNWGDASVQGGEQQTALRWVMYVAPKHQRPLYMQLSSGEITDSCILPDQGGIIIINPESSDTAPASEPNVDGPNTRALPSHLFPGMFQVVSAQLRVHLGLPIEADGSLVEKGQVLSAVELHQLRSECLAMNAAIAGRTLSSMARLLRSLPALEMPNSVGKQVQGALHSLQHVQQRSARNDTMAALMASYDAREMAEGAFQSPSILAQLSFPAKNKLAIYMPFFLPVSLPIVVNLIRELKRCR